MPAKKARRATIGADPLDAVVPQKNRGRTLEEARAQFAPSRKAAAEKQAAPKVRATFHLPQDLLDETRDAVVHLSGPPVRLTLAALAEKALRKELARLKKAHNKGKDFPRRNGDLKGGRPIGS